MSDTPIKKPRIGQIDMSMSTYGHNPMMHPPWITTQAGKDKWYQGLRDLTEKCKIDALYCNTTERQMLEAHEAMRYSGWTGYNTPEHDARFDKLVQELKLDLRVGHRYADARDKIRLTWGKSSRKGESFYDWHER